MKNRKTVISKKREEELASAMKGRRHVQSGSQWWKRGDASDTFFLWEDKYTDKAYYSLDIKTLNKLKQQAFNIGKIPALRIGFLPSNENFVVLRAQDCIIQNDYKIDDFSKKKVHRYPCKYLSLFKDAILGIILNDTHFVIMSFALFLDFKEKIMKGEPI
jgi:hypothetical protein